MEQREARQSWQALAVCMTVVVLAAGVRFSYGALIRPIEADVGWDRALLSAAASLNVLTYGAGQWLTGTLADRWGARRVIAASLLLTALGFYGLSVVSAAWQLLLLYGVVAGFGLAGASLVPAGAFLMGWFPRRPALAVGVASAGIPGGQALLVPAVAALIPLLGWRSTSLILALAMALIAAPLMWFLATDPPRRETRQAARAETATGESGGRDWGVAFFVAAGFLVCGLTDQLVGVHFVPFASGLGLSPVLAAGIQSIMAAAGVAGSLAAGRLADGWSPRGVLILMYLVRAATFPLLILFGAGADILSLYAFAALFGPTYIGTAAPAGRLLRDRYGQAKVGSYLGVTQAVHQVGAAVGIGLGGLSFTLLGSYGPAFAVASVAALAGAAVSLPLPGRRERRKASSASLGG